MKVEHEDLRALQALMKVARHEGAHIYMEDGRQEHEPWYEQVLDLEARLMIALRYDD